MTSGDWRRYIKRRWFWCSVLGLLFADVTKGPVFSALGLMDCEKHRYEEQMLEMHDSVVRLQAQQARLDSELMYELVELNRRVEALAK